MDLPTRTGPNPSGDHAADLDLARGARAGRREAVDRFLERMRCVPAILAARNRRAGARLDRDELADLAQDVLAVIWKKLDAFAGQASLETWAYRVCVLELMNASRAKRRRPATSPEVDGAERPDGTAPEPGARLDFDHVHAGLERLEAGEAEVLRLKHFELLTFEQIGSRLSISPNTAKTRYYRGLSHLREILRPHFPEEDPA